MSEEVRTGEPNIVALLSVLLAGLLALIGCLASASGLILQLDLLFQSLNANHELGDFDQRVRNYTIATSIVFSLMTILGMHNLILSVKWRAFLGGKWKRYLINSAAGLSLFVVLQSLRYVF